MSNAARKITEDDARINIRTKADYRQTISYAAELAGLDLTNFMISASMDKAREVIRAHEVMRIASAQDRATFREALRQPGRATAALSALLQIPPVRDASGN